MKIRATQRFRDGRTTYEPGQEYDVPDFDGARFVGNGWATSPDYTLPGAEPAPAAVDIRPDNVSHKATSTEVR